MLNMNNVKKITGEYVNIDQIQRKAGVAVRIVKSVNGVNSARCQLAGKGRIKNSVDVNNLVPQKKELVSPGKGIAKYGVQVALFRIPANGKVAKIAVKGAVKVTPILIDKVCDARYNGAY